MLRRLSLAGEAMAHAIVPGIVIAFVLFGLSVASMITGGMIAGIAVALGTSVLARRTLIREECLTCLIISDCLSAGDFYPVRCWLNLSR